MAGVNNSAMSSFQPYNPANKGKPFNQEADVYDFEPITSDDIMEQNRETDLMIEQTRFSLRKNSEARHE